MLAITHAAVYTPDRVFEDGAALIDGGRIAWVGPSAALDLPMHADTFDASGLLLVPGLIDLQLNGAFGFDFTHDPQTIWEVARRVPRYGVTAFLPTIITSPLDTVRQAQEVLTRPPTDESPGAIPLGLHLEGPFLNPSKKGAHNPAYLRPPALADIAEWSAERGVRLVTLAPELPGAVELATCLRDRGVVVSAGHSAASYGEARAGFETGIRYGTHLFNAMPPLHHRDPGLIAALLEDERLTVGLIADGEHVHPSVVKLVWQILGGNRLNLVTDAVAALGMPPGRYTLGEFDVIVDQSTVRLADGTLAGSILSMDAALRNLIAFAGCTLEEALPTLTRIAARLLNLAERKGQIAPGFDADLVLLTPDLRVAQTWAAGRQVYSA